MTMPSGVLMVTRTRIFLASGALIANSPLLDQLLSVRLRTSSWSHPCLGPPAQPSFRRVLVRLTREENARAQPLGHPGSAEVFEHHRHANRLNVAEREPPPEASLDAADTQEAAADERARP